MISALYPTKDNLPRVSSYPHFSTVLNFLNIEFPVKLKDKEV